ncbi:MAG: Stealth CR1 domain-containing protein [Paludibacter sp.]|nr:Stealth CR1 domain-containing protein [Paludibacter sp.]MDD4198229.1 Stealth CR1 domain-containing protein [Paludibacter sp.]MDD4427300.1 Stealth CR1 domain-containing protein [Paludibacter sp.]
MEIDFVITWVDMDDPVWKEEFYRYSGKIDNTKNEVSEARFRDYGLLKYWFRGVDKFAPWVRKIHFVTCGQKPDWLNLNHPKLNLVNHEDFIPKSFTPVFNSNLIEIYMHKIPGLAEHFVYFNDDVFIINHISENRFFMDGLPNDIAAFRTNFGLSQFGKMLKNNIRLINKHFDKKKVLSRDHDKWFDKSYGKRSRLNYLLRPYSKFVTLRTPHNAQPYLKRTFVDVWEKCGEELTEMSTHRFRSDKDYTPELFRTWQICRSNFTSYNTYQDTKMFPLVLKSKKAIEAVREQRYLLVCLNDNVHIHDYENVLNELKIAFDSILPQKSTFEL